MHKFAPNNGLWLYKVLHVSFVGVFPLRFGMYSMACGFTKSLPSFSFFLQGVLWRSLLQLQLSPISSSHRLNCPSHSSPEYSQIKDQVMNFTCTDQAFTKTQNQKLIVEIMTDHATSSLRNCWQISSRLSGCLTQGNVTVADQTTLSLSSLRWKILSNGTANP